MNAGDGLDPGAGVEFEPEGRTIQIRHSWASDDPLSEVVVRAVATATETALTDLAPLYESIDLDALNNLYAVESANEGQSPDGSHTFWWSGCEVTVYRADHAVVAVSEEMLA